MHIREILARNLRRMCDAEGNIVRICREIPLNRQQFNKYLSGSTMPHPRTLKKICAYFKISESELLRPQEVETPINDLESNSLLNIPQFQEICKNVSSSSLPELNAGIYSAYMVVTTSPIEVACSTIVVKIKENLATFRRLTNYSEPENSKWHCVRGDHRGIIVQRANWLYFIGIADMGVSEPSTLAVQWLPLSPKILSGTAFVGSHSGPVALPLIVVPSSPSVSLINALEKSKVSSLHSSEISPHIKNAINRRLSEQGLFENA